ncbi:MAG: TerC family protein [Deltaproteobacteria bacterium]|nr:TerC family protein [Deltaproteobacteria bacterium]
MGTFMTATVPPLFWGLFLSFVIVMLALDLGVFHRKAHVVKPREALIWTAVWVSLALLFCAGIYFWKGQDLAMQFLAGYLIEESLSVDNLFVFILIFSYFKVPALYQHKILFWGILGAIVLRAVFILAGITLIQKFHWTVYVLGVLLIITAIKMLFEKDDEIKIERNILLRIFRKFVRCTDRIDGAHFFTREKGILHATPLFLVLMVVEVSDVVFAVDSIPAILAISTDPFIVFTSNIFAIMGLRSLFFAVAGLIEAFHYLHYGLAAILAFVGTKMLTAEIYQVPIALALGVIAAILTLSILASILFPSSKKMKM